MPTVYLVHSIHSIHCIALRTDCKYASASSGDDAKIGRISDQGYCIGIMNAACICNRGESAPFFLRVVTLSLDYSIGLIRNLTMKVQPDKPSHIAS